MVPPTEEKVPIKWISYVVIHSQDYTITFEKRN